MLDVNENHNDWVFKVLSKDWERGIHSFEDRENSILKKNLLWERQEEVYNKSH